MQQKAGGACWICICSTLKCFHTCNPTRAENAVTSSSPLTALPGVLRSTGLLGKCSKSTLEFVWNPLLLIGSEDTPIGPSSRFSPARSLDRPVLLASQFRAWNNRVSSVVSTDSHQASVLIIAVLILCPSLYWKVSWDPAAPSHFQWDPQSRRTQLFEFPMIRPSCHILEFTNTKQNTTYFMTPMSAI